MLREGCIRKHAVLLAAENILAGLLANIISMQLEANISEAISRPRARLNYDGKQVLTLLTHAKVNEIILRVTS